MKSAFYDANGPAKEVLKIGDLPKPSPAREEVLVRVYASGVNPSDVKARQGLTRKISVPRIIPHSDGAGIIEAVGEGISRNRIGERIWIYNAQWGRWHGTACEYLALPSELAVNLPDPVDFSVGACLGIPAQTAHAAVFANGPVSGKTVLVQGGAGGVGYYAVQWAKLGGARVIATVGSSDKIAYVKDAGADEVLNYKVAPLAEQIRSVTSGELVDHIVEVEFGTNVGSDAESLKPNGMIVSYGSQQKMEPSLAVMPLMLKCATLKFLMVYNLDFVQRKNGIEAIAKVLQDGALKHPSIKCYLFDEIVAAHEMQESGTFVGKVIVKIADTLAT